MPIYEYECEFCSHRFQQFQRFSDPPPEVCPNCGKRGGLHKVISQTSFVLKGSGWYATDYKSTSASSGSEGASKANSKDAGKKEVGSSEGKNASNNKTG